MTGSDEIIIPGIESFAAGTHRGETYTVADLDAMVANFDRFSTGDSPLVAVPCVIGHEEEQSLLDNTGIPAVGWVKHLYRRGLKLFADVTQVFPAVADLIHAGAYRKVSAEIYDDPPEGVPGKGRMLRRLAFLGGELPQVKNLSDLPRPRVMRHSEAITRRYVTLQLKAIKRGPKGTHTCFFEGSLMTPEEMLIEKLKGLGIDEALLKPLNPEQLTAFAQALDKLQGVPAPAPAEEPPAEPPSELAEWPEGVTRESAIAELVGMGEDEAALNTMTDEQLLQLWMEKKGTPMSDPRPATPVATPAAPAPAAVPTPPAREPSQVVLKYGEQAKALEKRLADLERQIRRRQGEERRAEARAFCERMVQAGKLLSGELEAEIDLAMSVDAVSVRKFSDGSSGTAFDRWKKRLESRQSHRLFGEKVRQPSDPKRESEAETDRVRRFSETPGFRKVLEATGKTVEAHVKRFTEMREKVPSLTAVQFGVPADFE